MINVMNIFRENSRTILIEYRIFSQLSEPGTPPTNNILERKNMILLYMIMSMMSFETLPISFWEYKPETIAYALT